MGMATVIKRFVLALLMLWSAGACAYTLFFNPASQDVALGNKAYVDVVISGVQPNGLGNYDFDVLFDPAILAFDSAMDQFGLGTAIGLDAFPDTGRVTLGDFSLELPADLLAMQADNFPLLTLVFDTRAVGISRLDFDLVTLGDVNGEPVVPEAADSGSINVTPAQIPEPNTLALLLAGILAAALLRRAAKVPERH